MPGSVLDASALLAYLRKEPGGERVLEAIVAGDAVMATVNFSEVLKALRESDTLVILKLDRLGRDLRHLVNTVHDLTKRGVGLKVLAGQGANIDTTTANGRLVFGIFAALAEFERELIIERTKARLASARARGRNGGRKPKMTSAKLRLAQAAMGKPETKVAELCTELVVTRQTLYRHVDAKGELRPDGLKLLAR